MKFIAAMRAVGLVFALTGCGSAAVAAWTAREEAALPLTGSRGRVPEQSRATQRNEEAAALQAFQERVREYVEFHKKVEATVASLRTTDDAVELVDRRRALGEALIRQRPDAKTGDYFIAAYRPHLARIIADEFSKRSIADRQALIADFPKPVRVEPNMGYPPHYPLATFPARLLAVLPELPPEVEYRIVGRHLILRDVNGNVIIDVMRDVFPIPD
jgi:LmbE family N-acetylglucosaminyl deacetylase